MSDRYLRLPEVQHFSGLSKSTIRRRELEGTFPQRRQLGPKAVGWLESELLSWAGSRMPAYERSADRMLKESKHAAGAAYM